MHRGGCLCGRVRYEYDGDIDEVFRCYCTQCQKSQGGAFVAVAAVRSDRFRLVQGAEYVKEFRATANKARSFCGECASPLFSARDDLPEVKRLRVGTLETPLSPARQYHAFVAFKPAWYEINDEFEQFPGARPS